MTDNRIKQIADANGISTILNKLTEECGELVTAIAKWQASDCDDYTFWEQMVEEAVDVSIMVEQLRLSDTGLFDYLKEQKINRQLERMGVK